MALAYALAQPSKYQIINWKWLANPTQTNYINHFDIRFDLKKYRTVSNSGGAFKNYKCYVENMENKRYVSKCIIQGGGLIVKEAGECDFAIVESGEYHANRRSVKWMTACIICRGLLSNDI